jgi:cytosine/adenosine deaminase-related metal-dependent hydrolase
MSDGAIYVDGGVMEAVQDAADPILDAKYEGAPRIRTGDTIYPGLIELHNHLSYNAMPLWDVPQMYTNNGQWRGTQGNTREITKPSQVLGQTPGAAQALVRYAECQALLGGVTSSQGISLASAGGIEKYYRGIVRNGESPDHPDLPPAETKIANPAIGGAQAYLDTFLAVNTCYLQHLSEGTDDTARGWFLRLQIDDSSWAVNDVLCGIHCAALRRDDFDVLAAGGASMVWSPLSNYLLYGKTADIAAAKAAGVNMAIGSDWAPSGSKNLLGELKVAWLASRHAGDPFTPQELVAITNPARAVKGDHLLGSIEPGRLADLIVVDGQTDDPFEQLLLVRETSVTLVLINGTPRVGQKRLMSRFWPDHDLTNLSGIDRYAVARSTRYLYLTHDDDLLDGLPLSQAVDDLAEAMRNLPELAGDVDDGIVAPSPLRGRSPWRGEWPSPEAPSGVWSPTSRRRTSRRRSPPASSASSPSPTGSG